MNKLRTVTYNQMTRQSYRSCGENFYQKNRRNSFLMTRIEELDRGSLIKFLGHLQIPYDDTYELDDLQNLLFSISCSNDRFFDCFELSNLFQESYEFVKILVESSDNKVTSRVLLQLMEAHPGKLAITLNDDGNISDFIDKRSSILIPDIIDSDVSYSVIEAAKLDGSEATGTVNPSKGFGMHTFSCINNGNHTSKLYFNSSPTYEFTIALDVVSDRLLWCWEGTWTEDLERSLLELLIACNDELLTLIRQWKAIVVSEAASMEELYNSVTKDLQLALTEHTPYSIGRLHQTLLQFVEMGGDGESSGGNMFGIPQPFIRAVNSFIDAKLAASSNLFDLEHDVNKLVLSAYFYQQSIPLHSSNEINRLSRFFSVFHTRLQNLLRVFQCSTFQRFLDVAYNCKRRLLLSAGDTMEAVLSRAEYVAIKKVKPTTMEMFSYQGSGRIEGWSDLQISYMPALAMEDVMQAQRLQQVVEQQNESLLMECMNIDSLMGFRMDRAALASCCAVLTQLMDAGLAYVCSSSQTLIALFPAMRSALLLHAPRTGSEASVIGNVPLPPLLERRKKDMGRIFRNKVKGKLSFRVNSDVDLAIELLREHHGDDCWGSETMANVWRTMARTTPPRLLIFELWYNERMIAADFAHPTNGGRTVYVATRFFHKLDPDIRVMQPGFMLALVETKYLREQGCYLWDLGTVNMNPLMRYKWDLTGTPVHRAEALHQFRQIQSSPLLSSNMENIRSGVLIEEIGLQHV